jgi:threonyl-tRNA synthetase
MIHRTILGSIERFIGILIENYAGAFPLWISPVQAVVLTVTDRNISHGEKVLSALLNSDIRAEGDFRNEKLGAKIREAQMNKIPIMLVIGDKEDESDGVAPRRRSGENMPFMNVKDIIEYIQEETRQRR